jgi:hypothetical protein
VLTPFFLGTVAGGIASGRVPAGIARGDLGRARGRDRRLPRRGIPVR